MVDQVAYFAYPHRRPGLDHDHFDMRYLRRAAPVAWPGGKSIALWVTIGVDWFPMDMPSKPFMAPGGMARPYPDVWNYATRDYGNRIGIYRILKCLNELGVKATAFVQGEIANRYPALLKDLVGDGLEIAAGGLDMGHIHHGGLDPVVERGYVEATLAALAMRGVSKVRGWHSPAFSQSHHTLELLAEAGIDYVGDWVNDDMPYGMRTKAGRIAAMPYQFELADIRVLFEQNQSFEEFEAQVLAAFATLKAEATPTAGRILSLSLSPWVIGQPYRIQALYHILRTIMADNAVWTATGSEILDACKGALIAPDVKAAE